MNFSDIVVSPSLRPKLTRNESRMNMIQSEFGKEFRMGDLEIKLFSNAAVSPSHRPKICRDENRLNSLQDECHDKICIVDRFPMKEHLQQRSNATTKERLTLKNEGGISDKVQTRMQLPSSNRQHTRWLQHVKRLKNGQKPLLPNLPYALTNEEKPKNAKPFGKFVNTKPIVLNAGSPIPSRPEIAHRPETSHTRRVTFHIDKSIHYSSSMHTDTSATSKSTASSSHKKGTKPVLLDHSHHVCAKTKHARVLDKRSSERHFWSRKDIERNKVRSLHHANTFRSEYPATVKQLSKIFLDTCNQSSTYTKDFVYGDDEDQEEMLRDFLRDWAASNVRGLEEAVTGRNMFTDTRKMAVQSVLAYQQTIRENMCGTDVDRITDLLRARSESTSQRARMFAMYLALGDALVANSMNEESHFDDADISIQLE